MKPPCILTKSEWPPDYTAVFAWRQNQILAVRANPRLLTGAWNYYSTHPKEFVVHWINTFEPRNSALGLPTKLPLIMFEKQGHLVDFLWALMQAQEDGLVEKSRDMGATWVCCAFSVWLWLFQPGVSVGWGSRKEQLVDRIGDPDSIFEKIRMILRSLPPEFLPKGFKEGSHTPSMKLVNPDNGATITGEGGDNIGRGGRKTIYFKDESAHYERPEKIEAALGDNTRVQVDISSVNGVGNVFHRKREAGVDWTPGTPVAVGKTNVFVMDWLDHPEKDQAWFDKRKAKAEGAGLLHLFNQEVCRDYFSSVEGVLIKPEWVLAAIDAHLKLDLKLGQKYFAALDVADEGGDLNALAIRRSILLESCDGWGEGDTGKTARRAVDALAGLGEVEFQYDSVGVGAGVKAETNRLTAEGLHHRLTFVPWSAGAKVLNPEGRVIPGDRDSPLNEDFFFNLKAQGWWHLARRFERTFKAVTQGEEYDTDDLISLDSRLPDLHVIRKELGQVTVSKTTGSLKLVINKTPPGTSSPHRGDAIMMCYWPLPSSAPAMMFLRRSQG